MLMDCNYMTGGGSDDDYDDDDLFDHLKRS